MNSQYFSKEQIESGEMQRLLDYLIDASYGSGNFYNDIHIRPEDCGAFIIEWAQVPWSHEYGGRFEFIDENQFIVKEYVLPDNSFVIFQTDNDFNNYLREWLEENPGWVRTSFGTWTNELENKKIAEELQIGENA